MPKAAKVSSARKTAGPSTAPSKLRTSARPARTATPEKIIVGWREWVGLPLLGVSHIKAKLDTGARTSSLHAFDVEAFTRDGEKWIRFAVHPMQRDDSLVVPCEAPLLDQRYVTNSGGKREKRYVIETVLRIGGGQWPIELALTNRDEMGFRMLIGRTAMLRRLVVDPARSFRSTNRTRRPKNLKPPAEEVLADDAKRSDEEE